MNDIIFYTSQLLLQDYDFETYKRLSCSQKSLYATHKNNMSFYIYMMQSFLESVRIMLINASRNRANNNDVIMKLNDFESRLSKISKIDEFIEIHYEILRGIKFELSNYFKYLDILDRKPFIEFRDRIFLSKLQGIDVLNENRKVTLLFNEYLKGITYFNNEAVFDNRQPIYHRIGSCSEKGKPNFDSSGSINDSIRQMVEKCYLERTVFDEMWQHFMQSQQDENHLKWLKNTKNAYATCFPNQDLEVKVIYNESEFDSSIMNLKSNVPTILSIIKTIDGTIYKEVYEKKYDEDTKTYIDYVDCSRHENDNLISQKTNRFSLESVWVQIGGKPKCRARGKKKNEKNK